MHNERISVAMCTCNGARFLDEQLASIASQTLPPQELVVCDDCSSDQTVDIVKAFAREASFQVNIHVNKSNIGSTANFEQAIRCCTGDVIVLCDQDDFWYPSRLRLTAQAFVDHPSAGFVFGDGDLMNEKSALLGRRLLDSVFFSPSRRKAAIKGDCFGTLAAHNVVTGATMAFQSRYVPILTPIPSNWVHDAWIAFIIAAVAGGVCINEPLIKYREHSGQQLGVSQHDIATHLKRASAACNYHDYETGANAYAQALERISRLSSPDPKVIALARGKADHMRRRADFAQNRFYRIPQVARELLFGKYHRFGYGRRGVIRDLVVKLCRPEP